MVSTYPTPPTPKLLQYIGVSTRLEGLENRCNQVIPVYIDPLDATRLAQRHFLQHAVRVLANSFLPGLAEWWLIIAVSWLVGHGFIWFRVVSSCFINSCLLFVEII